MTTSSIQVVRLISGPRFSAVIINFTEAIDGAGAGNEIVFNAPTPKILREGLNSTSEASRSAT